jgi:hypothetical protein
MSLKFEQCTALLRSREFLRELLLPRSKPWTKKELKERAYSCLRHFPMLGENGMPYFSQDEFTKPDGGMVK